jgi:hypothetical protein
LDLLTDHSHWHHYPWPPQELLSLPPNEADARAAGLIDYFGFRNTYALGKHLTEKVSLAVDAGIHVVVVG